MDPALTASIVDVRELAGTLRSLEIFPFGSWLSATYEFWAADCSEVGQFQIFGGQNGFRVPRRARWLTIPGSPVGPTRWAIY